MDELRRMARAFDTYEPRIRWHLGLGLAGAAVVSGNPDQPTYRGLVDTADAGEFVLARPLPREPFKGQKRPPCTRYAEVELVGACWLPHKLKAPCPDVLYEYQGECYLPAYSAKPPPQSLGQ